MTLPASGPISFNNINVELGVAGTTQASIGQSSYRTLAGVASGQISMSNFYGKSNRVAISYTYSANTANASLNVTTISGYIAGKSDITITVNSGIYVYATSVSNAGLALIGGTSGDTLTLINNGYIMGQGGSLVQYISGASQAGGPAISLGFNTTINNTNASAYIGGGGGTGGGIGGGGAGGGKGSGGTSSSNNGGAGGAIGAVGGNGTRVSGTGTAPSGGGAGGGGGYQLKTAIASGAGGGRIFPGSGGAGSTYGGAGGSANNAGSNGPSATGVILGGGGGGWGASGGTGGISFAQPGAAGGKAVQLNGYSVTWVSGNTTRVYGSVA